VRTIDERGYRISRPPQRSTAGPMRPHPAPGQSACQARPRRDSSGTTARRRRVTLLVNGRTRRKASASKRSRRISRHFRRRVRPSARHRQISPRRTVLPAVVRRFGRSAMACSLVTTRSCVLAVALLFATDVTTAPTAAQEIRQAPAAAPSTGRAAPPGEPGAPLHVSGVIVDAGGAPGCRRVALRLPDRSRGLIRGEARER
jgi:hypothetical protein